MFISDKTRNALAKTHTIVMQVPEAYRKNLCQLLKKRFEDPMGYTFRNDSNTVIGAYHKICALYDHLCEVDKEQFKVQFSAIFN